MNKQQLIRHLNLEPHLEGGYYRRTYCAEPITRLDNGKHRPLMSSIFYLLTDDSPTGFFHCNRSDIVHYWQGGAALRYYLIDPQGTLQQIVLGPDLARGEQLQLVVPGGVWKATQLMEGEFGLLSEAVSPGFDYGDMKLASARDLQQQFPDLWRHLGQVLEHLCKPAT